MSKEWPGATHASEIPLVFDTVTVALSKRVLGGKVRAGDYTG